MNLLEWVKSHNPLSARALERDQQAREQRNQAIANFRSAVPSEILEGLGFDPNGELDTLGNKAWMERSIEDGFDTVLMVSFVQGNCYRVEFMSTRWNVHEETGAIAHDDSAQIARTYTRYAQSCEQQKTNWARQEAFRLVGVLKDSSNSVAAWETVNAAWHEFLASDFSDEAKQQAQEVFSEQLWRIVRGAAQSGDLKTAFRVADDLEAAEQVF